MKIAVFLVSLVMLASAFAASDSSLYAKKYIVAVPADAPAADVVFAANFAQTIKANTGKEFVGATQETVEDTFSEEDYAEHFIVYLDGDTNTAEIAAEDSRSNRELTEVVVDYLQEQGYSVRSENSEEEREIRETQRPTEEVESNDVEQVDEVAREDSDSASTPVPQNIESRNQQVVADDQVNEEEKQMAPEPISVVVEPRPSALQRFWGWLTGLFD